jgi:hypothetical protein
MRLAGIERALAPAEVYDKPVVGDRDPREGGAVKAVPPTATDC